MKQVIITLCISLIANIAKAQNVGIGTTNPKYKLDVKGMINTDSGLVVNNILVISSTGIFSPSLGLFTKIGVKKNPVFDLDVNGNINSDSAYFIKGNKFIVHPLQNLGMGINALKSTSTGNYNISFGDQSLLNNTTGSYNTAIGLNSLYTNTTGDQNTSVGVENLNVVGKLT